MGQAWGKVCTKLGREGLMGPNSGRELRSEPSLEFYLNDPGSTKPEELLTDIYAPLEPLS